jgi:hypothetical protein
VSRQSGSLIGAAGRIEAHVLHKNAKDRYDKLKKIFRRLGSNFNRDDLDDFISTANSLREWIRRDPTMSQEQRDHLERFVVPASLDWRACNEIANQQKHVTSQTRAGASTLVKNVTVNPNGAGFCVSPSRPAFGAGEEILIECNGAQESALGFVVRTFRHFHYIFEVAPIPAEQRDVANMPSIFSV